MNEIKFRLIEDGKVVGYERHIISTGTISIQHQKIGEDIWRFIYPDFKYWIPHDHKDCFTGLQDKNGKEMYENHSVKTKHGGLFTVIFENGAFRLQDPATELWHCELNSYKVTELGIKNKEMDK